MRQSSWLGIVVIACLALWLRWPSPDPGLNYDELQSVTFAAMPPAEILRTLSQLDPHPPLYYLQLHFWPGLLHGDVACRWNSVLWGMLALALFAAATGRMFGAPTAWITSLLMALSPLQAYYADSVRMYAMITALSGLAFLGVALMETAQDTRGTRLGAVLMIAGTLGAGWSQGAGFVLVGALALYFTLRVASARRVDRIAVAGFLGIAIIACALVPWLWRARDVSVGHLARPDMWRVAVTFKELLFGIGSWPQFAVYAAAGLVLVLCATAMSVSPASRRITFSFIVAPLAAMGLLSVAMRPIWDTRTVAWVAPFICVLAAVLLARALQGPTWRRAAGMLVAAALIVGMLPGIYKPFTVDFGYRELGMFLKDHATAADTVFAPKRDLWAVGWYSGAAGAIHPLKTSSVHAANNITNQPDFQAPPGTRVWLVYRDKHQADIATVGKRLTDEGFSMTGEKRFGLLHAVEYHARAR